MKRRLEIFGAFLIGALCGSAIYILGNGDAVIMYLILSACGVGR